MRSYNRCVMGCMRQQGWDLIQSTRQFLSTVEAQAASLTGPVLPLPGNLVRVKNMGFMHDIRCELNRLETALMAERRVANLSPKETQEFLSFSVRFDKHHKTAMRIRPADLDRTVLSLEKMLQHYATAGPDENVKVVDQVGMVNLYEILTDAARNEEVGALIRGCATIAGILKIISLPKSSLAPFDHRDPSRA